MKIKNLDLTYVEINDNEAQKLSGGSPIGSFYDSCENEKEVGRDLFADCKDLQGFYQPAFLADYVACKGPIDNVDGRLLCDK